MSKKFAEKMAFGKRGPNYKPMTNSSNDEYSLAKPSYEKVNLKEVCRNSNLAFL